MSALPIRRWTIILAPIIGAITDPAPGAEGRELIEAYAANHVEDNTS